MKNFNHTDAESLSQAAGILKDEQNNARIIAGGTDLLSVLKHKLEPDYPETIVNIKSIDGLDRIEEDEDGLKIGATAKLCDIASSPLIREEYGALADAARSVATPLIRNLATIGGNLSVRKSGAGITAIPTRSAAEFSVSERVEIPATP